MATALLQITGRAQVTAARRAQARRGLLIYFALLVPLSILFEWLMITHTTLWVLALMWTPTLASLVARLVQREGVGDVSFRIGGRQGWRAIGLAFILPLLIGFVAYGVAWATGVAQFVTPTPLPLPLVGLHLPPALAFAGYLLLALTVETLISMLTAAGEEIGWRGYMLTRLFDAGVPHPVLASGLIWAAWHVPLILTGIYAAGPSPVLSAVLFVISITAISYIFAWQRLTTGSIWPAIVLHAVWNSVIQGPFDHATTGELALYWTGESGLLTLLALVSVALLVSRRSWALRYQPPLAPEPARTSVQGQLVRRSES
jgi:membrane protease YdiL (CAAX protease family)